MNKKGVEMSLNVIIIAAIGLLILVILAVLVVNYVGKTNEGLQSCSAQYGGICKLPGDCTAEKTVTGTDCEKSKNTPTGKICCKVI